MRKYLRRVVQLNILSIASLVIENLELLRHSISSDDTIPSGDEHAMRFRIAQLEGQLAEERSKRRP